LTAIFSSVRARLLALVLVASIPVAVIAGSNAVARYQQNIAELVEIASLRREADAVRHATALDDLRQLVARLKDVADFPQLPPEECTANLRRVRTMFEGRYSDFWLLDAQGRLVCNSYGTPPGTPFDGQTYVRRSLASQDYALGDFAQGPVSRRMVLPAAVPLRVDGQVVGVIGGAILLDWFRATTYRDATGPRHVTWILDASGAPTGLDGQPPEALPAPPLIEELRASTGALTRIGASVRGEDYAYSISAPDRGTRVMVGLPATAAREDAQRLLIGRFVDLAAFMAVCLFIILYGAEVSCTRPLRRLAGRVRAWTPGTAFAAPRSQWDPDEVVSLGEAVTAAAETISKREAELTRALHQRDLLLAEIHHRVKNNLQIVASLLNMQGERIEDAALRAEFETARDRVQALSTLHRHLYMQGDIASVALVPLLHELGAQFTAVPHAPEVVVEADPVVLPAEQATSFALLVAEALANSIKHAFPGEAPGRIDLRLKERDGTATLEISDNGVGLPPDPAPCSGMGLTLIRGFAVHLGGEVQMHGEGGTRLLLRFPTQGRA
jgi:two-component sensor histidine kinase